MLDVTRQPSPLPLFYHSSRNHRDLPSFPTRRSSDLSMGIGRRRGRRAVHDRAGGVTERRGQVRRHRQPRRNAGSHPRGDAKDRKSTRLNSSHVEISYAVFCLKKKKKNKTLSNMQYSS